MKLILRMILSVLISCISIDAGNARALHKKVICGDICEVAVRNENDELLDAIDQDDCNELGPLLTESCYKTEWFIMFCYI